MSSHHTDGAGGAEPPGGLQRWDIQQLRAPNPGPLTLSGTNTWLLGRSPAWVIDPGPLIDDHLMRTIEAIDERGGLGGVALTHGHSDHSEAVAELLSRRPAPLARASGDADVLLGEGDRFGPLTAVQVPGHAPDHLALLAGGACFSGDAVLGEGSVFIAPYPGAMSGYLAALERLRGRGDIELICPGHGPVVWDPDAKLEQYITHRRAREQGLVQALAAGARSTGELLDAVWSDVPDTLRPAASATLAAHLYKLEEEGALPDGVERQTFDQGVV